MSEVATVDGLPPNEKACFLPLSFSVVSCSSSSSSSSITTASEALFSAGLPKKEEEGPGVIENPSDDVLLPNPPNVGLLLVSEVVLVVVVDLSVSLVVVVTEAKGDGDAATTA